MVDKLSRWVPLTGVVYVGLMTALLLGPTSPDSTDSGTSVIAWYQDHDTAATVQVFLLAYAAVFVLFFFGSLCGYLRRRGADHLATVVFGGAVLQAAAMCVGAGFQSALVDDPKKLSTQAAQALNLINSDSFAILLFVGLAVSLVAAGIAILRTRAFPTWLGWTTVGVGVVAASGIGSWVAFLASGPWILGVAYLLVRSPATPAVITLPSEPTAAARKEGVTTDTSTNR